MLVKRIFAVYEGKRKISPQNSVLELIGSNTLGIYLTHAVIYIPLTLFLRNYLQGYDWYIVDTACIVMTAFVVGVSLLIIRLIGRNAMVAKVLLGKIM